MTHYFHFHFCQLRIYDAFTGRERKQPSFLFSKLKADLKFIPVNLVVVMLMLMLLLMRVMIMIVPLPISIVIYRKPMSYILLL